ncbi:hypothetical protein [Streptomyces sp. NPDC059122]|uniref:hypothetical protein n=1 Tax=unclassified Streptomyces TaxID=2593676 RepID=UPI003697DCA7
MSSNTTVRTARRRTLRIAAAALTAAAALSLTACSGSDAGGAKAAGQASTGTSVAAAESNGAGSGAKADTKADTKTDSNAGAKAGTAGAQSGGSHAGTAKSSSPVRIDTLVDGSKAEIYELGDQRYRAKIISRGSVVATMETSGEEIDAGLDANDMFVVLTMGGEIHSWMGGGHQGPGTFQVAGGWKVKVTKVGELRYRAQIIGHDGVAATLETKGHDVGVDANGVYIVLTAGGLLSAHQ